MLRIRIGGAYLQRDVTLTIIGEVDKRVQTWKTRPNSLRLMENVGQPNCHEGTAAKLVQDSIMPWRSVWNGQGTRALRRHYIAEENGMKASCGVAPDIFDIIVTVCVPVQREFWHRLCRES